MLKIAFLVVTMTLSGALGAYFFKKASSSADKLFNVIFKPALYAGGSFYVMGALLNILVLKELPYTVVLPLTSITYIWTLIISYMILDEKITRRKIIGVILILVGSFLLCAKIPL
ncbi:MAG: EamA family transporter [Clostridiaceae bacterium]